MIYHVYANQSNVGDWLSARGIQSLLGPGDVKELLCDEPFVEDTLSSLKQATPDDFIVIGGGGLFMDYFNPFWEGFRAIAGDTPFAIWGVGCCDMKREDSLPPRGLISEIVSKTRMCSVRDELTRSYLNDASSPTPVICPAVMAVMPRSQGSSILHVDSYDNAGHDVWERMVEVSKAFARRTGRAYRATNNLIPARSIQALNATLDTYGDADLVVTSRLHGCIIAMAMGRPVLAVSGDRKVESFMKAAGMSEWVCDIDDIDRLPEMLESLPRQNVSREFIEQGRRENLAIGGRIRSMIGGERGGRNTF